MLVKEQGPHAAGDRLIFAERQTGLVSQAEQPLVVLAESVQARAEIVRTPYQVERCLQTHVLRAAMVGGNQRIVGPAGVFRAVEMVQRRDGQQRSGPQRAHPGEVQEGIHLFVGVADPGDLVFGSVGDLVVILPKGSREAQLVVIGKVVA